MSAEPEHVAVETPRGNRRDGRVVDRELEADANGCRYRLTVRVGDSLLAFDEADVAADPR